MKTCEFWPKGAVPDEYYDSDVVIPVLILSGDLDPATPPAWGEAVSKHLVNARHIVVPGTGHGAIATGCGSRLAQEFIDSGTTDGLDTSCLQGLRRPPFFPHTGRARSWWRQRCAAVIRVENLQKCFGLVRAVDDISFTACDGAVTGLLGPNGAGKTTTLRMLHALMRPDQGSIMVDGVDAVAEPCKVQRHLGVLPDVSGLGARA